MISSGHLFRFFEGCMIFAILQNLLFWIGISPIVYSFIILLCLSLIIIFREKWCTKNNNYYSLLLLFILLLLFDQILYIDGLFPALTKGVLFALGIGVFSLKDDYKIKLIKVITNFFGGLLGISLIAYIINLIFNFPPYGVLNKPFGYDDYYNYIIFIIPCKFLIPRFSGPFIEPGHMSILCCFILYANRFKFKEIKILYVFLIAILFSLSLAGYLLLVVATLLSIRIRLKTIIISCFVGITLILTITQFWGGGDNPVYEMIFKRLEYDDKKGVSGNNRTKYGTDDYFDKMFKSDQCIIGIGAKKYAEFQENNILGGAGYKVFIIQYGVIGTFLILLYYLTIALAAKNQFYALSFLLLLSICFLQRSYPEWMAWMIPYICSIVPLRRVEPCKLIFNKRDCIGNGNKSKMEIR